MASLLVLADRIKLKSFSAAALQPSRKGDVYCWVGGTCLWGRGRGRSVCLHRPGLPPARMGGAMVPNRQATLPQI